MASASLTETGSVYRFRYATVPGYTDNGDGTANITINIYAKRQDSTYPFYGRSLTYGSVSGVEMIEFYPDDVPGGTGTANETMKGGTDYKVGYMIVKGSPNSSGNISCSIELTGGGRSYSAKWKYTTSYITQISGISVTNGYTWKSLGSGSTSSVSYDLSKKQVGYYLYTPSSDGTLTIYTSSSGDTYGGIGVNGNLSLTSDSSASGSSVVSGSMASDDNSGTDNNFRVSGVSLSANTTYRIYVHQYSGGQASGTLYMSFIKTYTVTYDANGGSGTMSNHTNITPGNSIKLQANGFTVPSSPVHGITLYDSDGTTKISSSNTSFYNNAFYRWLINGNYYKPGDSYEPKSNTIAKATWSTNYRLGSATKNPTKSTGYIITYNSNGGNCSRKTDTITDTISYEFSKWIIISSSGNEYNPGTLIGGPAAYSYKAKWNTFKELGSITLPTAYKNNSEIIATITLNPTKGKCDIISMTSKGIISYSFNGWYFNNEYIGTVGDSYTPSNNITLTANYTSSIGSYNRIFLPTPYRSGYKFLGWSTNPNAKLGIFGYYTPTGNDILYAIWQENFIFININGLMKKAQAFIFNNNKWNETQIFINNNNQWNKTG